MVNQQRYCAAANCDNAAEHLFKWPEHKNSTDLQRQAWMKFVCDKVKNFSLKKSSRLCWRHFHTDMFANYKQYVTMKDEAIRLVHWFMIIV